MSQFQFEISGLRLVWCHSRNNYYLQLQSVSREGGIVSPPQEREGGFPSVADNMINDHSFSVLLITTVRKKRKSAAVHLIQTLPAASQD